MREVTLQGAQLDNAQFIGADVREAGLQNTDFTKAEMQWSNFSRSQLQGAYFTEGQLGNADFTHAQLQNASFSFANMYHANLVYANLQRGAFVRTIIEKADFSMARVQGTNLNTVPFSVAYFYGIYAKIGMLSEMDVTIFPRSFMEKDIFQPKESYYVSELSDERNTVLKERFTANANRGILP